MDAVHILMIWAIRGFYLLSSLAILAVRLVPVLATRFLSYGARSDPKRNDDKRPNETVTNQRKSSSVGMKLLDDLATLTVPHSWFIHFYVFSFVCSCVTLSLFYLHGYLQDETVGQNFSVKTPAFCALLMLFQGLRRLLECTFVTKSSSSRMWIGHYAIGMAFYLFTNVAIWIEQFRLDRSVVAMTNEKTPLWTWRTMLCTLIFFVASFQQNTYHRYLSSLQKYTLPNQHAFRYIIAPHYTMECVIYLSLASLDAPPRFDQGGQRSGLQGINWTLLCALIFVAVNLGVTADETKEWQRKKFRDEGSEIEKRWRMIPWVY